MFTFVYIAYLWQKSNKKSWKNITKIEKIVKFSQILRLTKTMCSNYTSLLNNQKYYKISKIDFKVLQYIENQIIKYLNNKLNKQNYPNRWGRLK